MRLCGSLKCNGTEPLSSPTARVVLTQTPYRSGVGRVLEHRRVVVRVSNIDRDQRRVAAAAAVRRGHCQGVPPLLWCNGHRVYNSARTEGSLSEPTQIQKYSVFFFYKMATSGCRLSLPTTQLFRRLNKVQFS